MISNHRKVKSWILPALVLLLMTSCTSSDFFNEYKSTGSEGWYRDSVLYFEVNIQDTVSPFDMHLRLRHIGLYPYQNLWMKVELINPDSLLVARDTLELILSDHTGKWLGAGSGPVFQFDEPYRLQTVFGRSGNYTFKLSHCMNDSLLKGVTHAGLRISNQNGKK